MKLEFSKKSIPEILQEFDDKKTFEWQNEIFDFLRKYDQKSDDVNLHYTQKDQVFTSIYKHNFVNDAFLSLNNFLGLKKGDTALMSSSALSHDGEIILLQAIVGQLDLYCTEFTEEIKIPYTGEDQTEIGFAIDYAFLTGRQVVNSSNQIYRINKVAIEENNLDDALKNDLIKQDKIEVYQFFMANGLPIASKNLKDDFYTIVDKIDISVDDKDYLILNSSYENEALNTERQAVLTEDKTGFRWLTGNECRIGDNKEIINLTSVEEKLKPYIDYNFVVIDFPEKETKKDVITLVIESRFAVDVNIPEAELNTNEVPQQTFFIGEFPQTNDKSAIRAELKKLLKESNE